MSSSPSCQPPSASASRPPSPPPYRLVLMPPPHPPVSPRCLPDSYLSTPPLQATSPSPLLHDVWVGLGDNIVPSSPTQIWARDVLGDNTRPAQVVDAQTSDGRWR
ncbi:UNVERIFIED_CONTAM: hypothetical protein Sindi_1712500 [Sesamum indicum]